MKAIITGSEGFIGRNLVRKLEHMGYDLALYDLKEGTDMFQAWPRADVVYHLACVNQEEAVSKMWENVQVNALGAKFAAEYCENTGTPLVYTSTASVYGQARTIATPVDAELDPKSDYAIAKLAGEYFVRKSNCNYSIYRLSNVYGPGQTTDNPYCGVIGKFIERAEAGDPLRIYGDGLQTRDYTYIEDVLDVLAEPDFDNTVKNVSRSEEVSVLDLVRILGDVYGHTLPCEHVPPRSVDGISRRKLITDYRCPTNLYDGLQKTVTWYRSLNNAPAFL